MRPTTQKQASRRAEIEARRHDDLQLKIAGCSDREIARSIGVGVSTAHRDIKNVLEALAREHADDAGVAFTDYLPPAELLYCCLRSGSESWGLQSNSGRFQIKARPGDMLWSTM